MANIFHIISSYSNDTYRIKLVLSVYWTFLRKNFGTASDNLPSMESLINLMKGVFVLKTRTQDSGLVTASNNLLTSIWKYIDKRLEGFGTNELVLISSVYFDTISEKKKTSAKFNADLSSKVLHEIDKKFDDFILSHLITIIEHTHKIRHFPLHVVSVDGSSKDPDTSSSKEYTCVDQIKEKWVRKLSDNLVNLTTNDLADAIYSLSLHHSSLLCQYLISHDLYITPVSTVIENRIKFLFGQDDKNKKDYLSLARLFLTLPEDSELRETFREINTEKVFKGLSANNILELFYISKYVPETTKILSLLAEQVALGHIQLSSRDIHFILENIDNFKDKKVVTDLILYHISGYTFSKPKEYFELLNISKYFSRFSVEDIPGMQDLIFSNLFKFLPSCSMEELELIFRYVSRSTIKDEEIESILSRLLNVDVGEASSRQIASVLEKLCELRIRHDAIIKRFVHAFTQKFHTCGEHTDKWADLTKVVKSTANLGIYNDDLYEFSRSVLGVSEHNFDSLDLQDRINFLHGLSLIDASDPTFEEKFISVVEEFSASTKKIMTDANICLKIYEIYINRLFANSANPSMRNPTTDNVLNFVNKVMQEWPCYHWFKNEEKIHMQFKNSIDYITIRVSFPLVFHQIQESLEKLGMHSVESKITEVYFCHFVLTLENSKIAMICVPDESLLTWLNADEKNDNVTNQIGHSRVEFGDCSRRIEHMRRSDWKVSIIYLSEWRKLNLEDRPTYLLKRIKQ
ncbi:hypothetical protein BEWA_023970 [Theileria equi strain WA]|uniref:RAP domain-containing protein n=1 Tax=Theileria equi strain WA TaxID=1537102 RepID=L0AWC6_THEEQ|nr:hypothetical protein BEWA_023970 [Theileria equi strain WA]AFZ79548.1 hypothetical protein BEWA_023970 [Theileria equi strain WA]|eukprot:XP_004829214.1 hypothetical protein BEWA_023970 [Theileria equi strain WA]